MPLKKLKSDLPTGRYGEEIIWTQWTLLLLDDSYGFYNVIIFTQGEEVKNATEKFKIRPSHMEI